MSNVSRDPNHLHPELRWRWFAFEAGMLAQGHPVFVYTTFRTLEQQAREVGEGDSTIFRGYHNLVDPETGEPAARAFDYAFEGPDSFSKSQPWSLGRYVGRSIGLQFRAWNQGDLGHAVWVETDVGFDELWNAQARHHAA